MATRKPGERRPDLPEVDAFPDHLKAILKRRQWKPSRLAKEADVAEPLVSRILAGERKPDINTLIRLARALGMTTDALLGVDLPSSIPASEPTITRVITRKIKAADRTT